MNINGLLMQERQEGIYQGIEGNNWYLNYGIVTELEDYYQEHIQMSWQYGDYVDVCNNINYIQKYILYSKLKNINFRVLACITDKKLPQMILPDEMQTIFLGYDYAYSGGSYYSAILNDIVSKRITQFANLPLNEYGIFETYQQAKKFADYRDSIKKVGCHEKEYLEEGDFIIYELHEVITPF